ncbi:MAG: nuclear transport factor 2 family protein [Cyanobacteria bacterium P01_G01_bin.54]
MSPLSEPQIIAAEERLRQAMLHSDVAELDALIAPTLLFTTHWGQRLGKADDLAIHRSGSLNLQELTPVDQQIQLHEQFAVVSVQMQLRGEYEGNVVDETLRYTRVWAMSSARVLQVVAGHASAVG